MRIIRREPSTNRFAAAAVVAAIVARRRVMSASARSEEADGVLGSGEVRVLHDRLAPWYDVLASGSRLVGASRLRREAVTALHLGPGDTVVDLGCGTGALLPRLAEAVAPGGRVIGVDLSPEMLERARARMSHRSDVDVRLVHGDIRRFGWPDPCHGVIATFALEMVPGYDRVIADAARMLAPAGGRIAVSGLRGPDRWPWWAVSIGLAVGRPFGLNEDYMAFRPWEAVRRHSREVVHDRAGAGTLYLSVGEVS